MRIEEYRRDLIEGDTGGFMVMGSTSDWNLHDSSRCDPIKMSLTCSRFGSQIGIGWEELIRLASSDCLLPGELEKEMYPDFQKHYPEVLRGECPDWQLGAFKVFYGWILLYFGNRRTHETAFLRIDGAKNLRLTFEAPRTRLGFIPTYKVSIDCDEDGKSVTEVVEDLGYVRREIHFEPQYLEIAEYAGI